MKKNYKHVFLLLMSIMLTLSVNNAYADNPTEISTSQTIGSSSSNTEINTIYPNTDTDSSTNGGLYNVTSTGSLTIIDTNNEIEFANKSVMYKYGVSDGGSGTIYYDVGRYGGIVYNAGDLYIGTDSDETLSNYIVKFTNNTAGNGGAIYNAGDTYIYNAVFDSNIATAPASDLVTGLGTAYLARGGAIFNDAGKLTITKTIFNNNSATSGHENVYGGTGGAIYNMGNGEVTITQSAFTNNNARNDGGAIYNNNNASSTGSAIVNIDNTGFSKNYAKTTGGAIYNVSAYNNSSADTKLGSYINISNSIFDSNIASSGGAIYNYVNNNNETTIAEVNITSTTFSNNGGSQQIDDTTTITTSQGGAIWNSGQLNISANTAFSSNTAVSGGAIYNTGIANIYDTTFTSNTSSSSGGAIFNGLGNVFSDSSTVSVSLTINNATFTSNQAISGGAIYNAGEATIVDSTFNGNSANNGGAIYGAVDSTTTVIAQDKNVNFATSSDTIYLNAGAYNSSSSNGAILNLNANAGKSINLNGAVTAATASSVDYVPVVNVNYSADGETSYAGDVNFNAEVSNVDLKVYNGTATANAQVSSSTIETQGGTMKFTKDEYLGVADSSNSANNSLVLNGGTLDIQNGAVSSIALSSFALNANTEMKVDVDVVNETMDNLLSDNIDTVSIAPGAEINISSMNLVNEGAKDSADILFTDLNGLTVDNVTTDVETLEGKIYKYTVEKKSGNDLGLSGDAADDVYFSFQNTGSPSDNVTVGPVAQIGAWILMDNIYRQSFANMDMLSILTRDERENLKNYNRYANMFEDEINTFYRDKRQEDYPSVFVRGFTNFEKVPLKRGPHVDGIYYGSLVGHESGLYELGRGWDANYAVFGAYTGAYQHYNGVNMFLNGGNAGGVFTAYKGDYWAGITANAGGWAVDANTNYGSEHFPMMGAGVAAKTGYNWRLFDNKFIIQPSYMMSYTFIYAYSHTSAAGVRINQDPLHAIEIIPGVKLIANNFKNGWQPYIGVNMTWVLMDGAKFWANDIAFSRLSIRPFVEYGIGIQKHHGEHVTGYFQAMVRNGGRNGVALTGGFRWAIGEDIID